jgi:hypothetical protein
MHAGIPIRSAGVGLSPLDFSGMAVFISTLLTRKRAPDVQPVPGHSQLRRRDTFLLLRRSTGAVLCENAKSAVVIADRLVGSGNLGIDTDCVKLTNPAPGILAVFSGDKLTKHWRSRDSET